MKIVVLGPPLSGKSTIGKTISHFLNIPHLSIGGIIRRDFIEAQNKAYYLNTNDYPEGFLGEIIKKELKKYKTSSFIIEGYPKNKREIKEFKEMFKKTNLLFVVDITKKDLLKRACGRLVCNNCFSSFNLNTNPPKISDLCDFCESRLFKRVDDVNEIIKNKLDEYETVKEGLTKDLEEMSENTIFIDGNKSIGEINKEIILALK